MKQAFFDPINLFILFMVLIATGLAQSAWPLLFGIFWEIGYLAVIPHTAWFRRRQRIYQDVIDENRRVEERQALRMQITGEQDKRYERLRKLADEIKSGAKKAQESGQFFAVDLAGLDALVHSFLELLAMRRRYAERVKEFQPEKLDAELAEVNARLEKEQNLDVRRILEQNRELLEKRRTMADRVASNVRVLDAQTDAIENTLQLMADMVIAMKATPNTITGELEAMIAEVEVTDRILKETAPALDEMQRLINRNRALNQG